MSAAAGNGTAGAISFEFWATVAETHTWQRFGDFGTSDGGEDTSSGGGASSYVLITPNSGRFADGLEITNHPSSNAAEPNVGTAGPSPTGVESHVVAVYDHTDPSAGANGTMTLYLDGGLIGTNEIHADIDLPTMVDNNNWLGRSQWNDPVFDGSYNEFRIYDHALSATQVSASFTSGADTPVNFDEDFDGDGMPDLYEDSFAFLDRTDPSDAAEDEDMDDLTNLEECNLGTRPDLADTDGDLLDDGDEVNTHGTSPLDTDSDDDDLTDGEEINTHSTDPNDPDSDDDLIPDGYETLFVFLDPNNAADAGSDEEPDGLTNLEEFNAGTQPDNADSDDDDLNDGDEVNTHLTDPLDADSDDDALTDGAEVNTHTTLPLVADTDGDCINDGPEVAAGSDPLIADATAPRVIHRYSFNESEGAAGAGTTVSDLIGSADGTIVGAGGTWTGTALALPGGDGATADAAYVDLPNGILSAHAGVTFEAWYTVSGIQNWSRIWDFGSTEGGEVIGGNAGATAGQDYFMFAPNQGQDINLQRFSVRNLDAAALGGGLGPVDDIEEAFDSTLGSITDQEYHVAGVWTSDGNGGGQTILYRDGVPVGGRTTTFAPPDMNDVNNWLGRSNWTGDNYLQGELNEFRIYEGAMSKAAVEASFNAGPDAAIGGDLRILEIVYDAGSDQITLRFTSRPGRQYTALWGRDLSDLSSDIADDIDSEGDVTTFGPFGNPSPGAARVFFRISENSLE